MTDAGIEILTYYPRDIASLVIPAYRLRRRSRVKRTIATRSEPTLVTAVRYDDEQAELGGRHGSSGDH